MKLSKKLFLSSICLTSVVAIPTVVLTSCSKTSNSDFIDLSKFNAISSGNEKQYVFVGNMGDSLLKQNTEQLKTYLKISKEITGDQIPDVPGDMLPGGLDKDSIKYAGMSTEMTQDILSSVLSTKAISFMGGVIKLADENQLMNVNENATTPMDYKKLNKSDANLNVVNNSDISFTTAYVEATIKQNENQNEQTIDTKSIIVNIKPNTNWSNGTNYPILLVVTDFSAMENLFPGMPGISTVNY